MFRYAEMSRCMVTTIIITLLLASVKCYYWAGCLVPVILLTILHFAIALTRVITAEDMAPFLLVPTEIGPVL